MYYSFCSALIFFLIIVAYATFKCFFRERDDEIVKLSEMQKQQAHQAETALEDFKSQVERNSGRMFDEMKHQVCC